MDIGSYTFSDKESYSYSQAAIAAATRDLLGQQPSGRKPGTNHPYRTFLKMHPIAGHVQFDLVGKLRLSGKEQGC